jgi:hypothetical protein
MSAGVIEADFAAEIGAKIVNLSGHSALQNGKEPTPQRAGPFRPRSGLRQSVPRRHTRPIWG